MSREFSFGTLTWIWRTPSAFGSSDIETLRTHFEEKTSECIDIGSGAAAPWRLGVNLIIKMVKADKQFGVPSWNGLEMARDAYCEGVKWYEASLKENDKKVLAARLVRKLEGAGKQAVKGSDPDLFQG